MNNNNDWDEIEKWNQERIKRDKEKFGYEQQEFKREKTVDNLVKAMNITGSFFKVIRYIVIFIVVSIIAIVMSINLSNIKSQTTIDVVETLENKYKLKVSVNEKKVDDKEDGIYKLAIKDNERVKFTAIKKGNQLMEDLSDQTHKYYFELWNDSDKSKFKVFATYNNELLEYHTYIEVKNKQELEQGIEIMNKFVKFCGKENLYVTWDLYFKIGEYRIYPYEQTQLNEEEIRKIVFQKYYEYTQKEQANDFHSFACSFLYNLNVELCRKEM